MGDFNGKIGENIPNGDKVKNDNGKMLIEFCEDSDLTIVNTLPCAKGTFTWFRNHQQSVIDYFLISDKVTNNLQKFIVDDDMEYHLGSDHNVLLLCLNTDHTPPRKDIVRNEKWNFKNNTDWKLYEKLVSDSFCNWGINFTDNDPNVIWEEWKNKLVNVAQKGIGKKSVGKGGKGWWDNEIEDLINDRREACRKYRKWAKTPSDCKDESTGNELWSTYVDRKIRASKLVNSKILNYQVKRSVEIAKAGGKSCKLFWKNLKGQKPQSRQVCIYDCLGGNRHVSSNEVVIKSNLRHYWNTLGKMNVALEESTDVRNSFHEQILQELHLIRDFDRVHNCDDSLPVIDNIEITHEDVTKAISSCHNGKACGTDDIPNELLKHGGHNLIRSLAILFTTFAEQNKIPDEWRKGIIIPIFKSGDPRDLNNYRGITLNSCLSKLYTKVIETKLREFIENNNILGEIQGGFRKDRRCEDNIFMLKGIATLRKSLNKSTYVAFLDFSKAFDCVWRDGLRVILWKVGIRGHVWKIIDDMYDKLFNKVKLNDIETDYFETTEGVKQGCVLSPLLFSIYINKFAKMLKNSNVGVQINTQIIPGIFWADDVVLIANNHWELQTLLHIAADFALKWRLSFNQTKSEIMFFGRKLHTKDTVWKLGDLKLKETKSYNYLGIIITKSLKDHEHFKKMYQKGMKLIAYCKSLINHHNSLNRFEYWDVLWMNIVLPSISYGSSIWFLQSAVDTKKLKSLQYQFGKFLFRVNRNVACHAVLGDSEMPLNKTDKYLADIKFNILAE
ncbi:uncharacterized protein LOC144440039 [Glandiceps talaboti]